MGRTAAAATAAVVALVAAPGVAARDLAAQDRAAQGGGAWTVLAGGVQATVVPSLLVTHTGTTLASFDSPTAGTISVSRDRSAPTIVVTGDPAAGRTQLLQQPNGAIQLYFPTAQGVARLTSTDDGASWTGPIQTAAHAPGPVQAAALLPDGTPLFAQDGDGALVVYEGLNGETAKTVYPRCCASRESLAVDTAGLVQIAFYSNADPDGATVYEPLGTDLSPASATPLKPVAPHETPLVSDRAGNTFLAWAPGFPVATGLSVVPFRGGLPAGDGVSFLGFFDPTEPHMALAVDEHDALWAVWTQLGVLLAARSRSHGMHFGATVRIALPGAASQLTAAGLSEARGGPAGTLDVVVNLGSNLVERQIAPGLAVRVYRTRKVVHGRRRVVWWAQALDDGFGVPGATFSALGCRTARCRVPADGQGRVRLTGSALSQGSAKAAAPGYVGASFDVP